MEGRNGFVEALPDQFSGRLKLVLKRTENDLAKLAVSNFMLHSIGVGENELCNMIAKYCNSIPLKNKQENKTFTSKNNNNNVINLTYLNELSNGQSDFIDKIIALFLSEIPIEIQHLETSVLQRDFKSIYACAHKIKSTISFAGLDDAIKKDLEQIEELATKNENVEKIEMHFSKVKEICFKALDELITFKSNHA